MAVSARGVDLTGGIVLGGLVRWMDQFGVVDALNGNRVSVHFDSGEKQAFTVSSGVLERHDFNLGDQVQRLGDGIVGVVLGAVAGAGNPTWRVSFPGGYVNIDEAVLRPATIKDPAERMRGGQLGTADEFNVRSVAEDYWTAHHHNDLVSLAHARVDLKPYQVSVVHRVITHYPHRFMLCDEVGLGKTIEAAMILKELRSRGQARRVLILTPSGLTRQWQYELKTKFNEKFAIYNSSTLRFLKDKGITNPWTDADSIIASHAWASGDENRGRDIMSVDWDLIIVDEAHHARVHANGTRTQLFRLVSDLVAGQGAGRRAALFLTATPLQLHRRELYSLVDMLDPVLFVSQTDFEDHVRSLAGLNQTVERLQTGRDLDETEEFGVIHDVARFLGVDEAEAETLIRDEGALPVAEMLRSRHRLSEVLIRNRKAVVMGFQPRVAHRWKVELSPDEELIYRRMEQIFQEGFRLARETNQHAIGFLMVTFQKLLASSSRALLVSLKRRRDKFTARETVAPLTPDDAETYLEDDHQVSDIVYRLTGAGHSINAFDDVIAALERVEVDSKARVLRDNVRELCAAEGDCKVLIFTEFRETQQMLVDLLSAIAQVNKFHGQMSAEEKDAAVARFRDGRGAQILVSTEAGGEGRNFQFCHHLVNYDLPWNPMKVEQRIGRLDRIGQDHPISIFNLYVEGTVEARVLDVLERRIKVFEEAVGSLDPILGDTEADIRKALELAARERDAALENLGLKLEREIEQAKEAESKLDDFIMQDRRFSAEIAQKAARQSAPITQREFESFVEKLLASVGTYIGPERGGERTIVFHAPFTVEHKELLDGQDKRRVCFDPGTSVDSELVEYLGFGHPIIDALVRLVTTEEPDGAAAVRRVAADIPRGGWQFNWVLDVGGLKPKKFVFPVFVDDAGIVDLDLGSRLLRLSRRFEKETCATTPPLAHFDTALAAAQEAVMVRRDTEVEAARAAGAERVLIEEERLRALFNHRTVAAEDRITRCVDTLTSLEGADESRRTIVPVWEANLTRAQAELQTVRDDFEKSLIDLNKRRNPGAEFFLLNVARVEPAPLESPRV